MGGTVRQDKREQRDRPALDAPRRAQAESEPQLIAAAGCTARAAAALLSALDAPFLTIARDLSVEPMRIRLIPWSDRLTPLPELDTRCVADPALRSLIAPTAFHGAETCRLLARRWPQNAVPPIVGVVTDGTGLAVSPDRPCAATADWMIAHARGRARPSIVLPFADGSAWAMLGSAPPSGSTH